MIGFDKNDLQRIAVAVFGAAVLATACVGAVVGYASASQFSDLANA
jgi:hypothetical protein